MSSLSTRIAETLAERIRTKQARCGVIGLGYVGLPLAVEFAQTGYDVVGFDVQDSKVQQLAAGISYVQDVPSTVLQPLVQSGKISATTDFSRIAEMDTINICVPTPLSKTKDPDMRFIETACQSMAPYIKEGTLVILESTTYPGTTDEVVRTLIERGNLRVGENLFLCFSPERVDPGNTRFHTRNIPKVVGGTTPACVELGTLLYAQALDTVVPVSSTRVAEMVKLLENTFRMINIGMANELAIMCRRMGIDVWEVIDAAATKPFGFMPFYPGPGLGGHCIPIDPFYLSWKSKQFGVEARFIELAGHVNAQMPHHVVDTIMLALNDHQRKALNGSHIHIAGVAYKRDIDDVRESPALDIAHLLSMRGARITYSDPYVPVMRIDQQEYFSQDCLESAAQADCVVVITNHTDLPYEAMLDRARLLVDTRNAYKGNLSAKIVRL
jgi:UDP-N-acetyl-D-glucosamine dehydrogenase